jgi:hypothetical protein
LLGRSAAAPQPGQFFEHQVEAAAPVMKGLADRGEIVLPSSHSEAEDQATA